MVGFDANWNNREEHQTIIKGKLSEQTLRQQYGLSAERFGHIARTPDNTIFDAFEGVLNTATEVSRRDPGVLDSMLKQRGFEPSKIPEELKLQISDSDLKGPIPLGWQTGELTFQQLKDIIGPPQIDARLGEFGWTPFGLNGAQDAGDYRKRRAPPSYTAWAPISDARRRGCTRRVCQLPG